MEVAAARAHRDLVVTDHVLLAQLVSLAALIAITAEYSTIIRRRVARRALDEQRAVETAGLHGLVRVFLADPPA